MCQRGAIIDALNRTIQLNSTNNSSKLLIHLSTLKRVVERCFGGIVKDVKSIPVVREFLDVFPDDLPSLPPDRDVEFVIELKPSTAPVSIRAYQMPPKDLAELKV